MSLTRNMCRSTFVPELVDKMSECTC